MNKVIALIEGGSKTTVLTHMRRLMDENGSFDTLSAARRSSFSDVLDPLLERILETAVRLSREEAQERLETLAALNAGLALSIEEISSDLEEALRRAEVAEARVARLETEAARRDEFGKHLTHLSSAIRALKGEEPVKPAMLRHVEMLATATDGPSRADMQRRLSSEGYTDKQIQAARHHGVKNGYIEERGEPPRLFLTDKGSSWVERQLDRVSLIPRDVET